ncbi:MAG: hypothetical protein MJZ20_04570 [Bacteroidaceae bacterium]|nr:hypothetical protein [Bacteroidaceae bacterium]
MKYLSFILAFCCVVFVSCDNDDKTSVPPTLASMVLPEECTGGDTLNVVVKVADHGKYCSWYKGTVQYNGTSKTFNITPDEYGDLRFIMVAPEANTLMNVSFFATVSCHAGNTLYMTTNTVSAKTYVNYEDGE